jgi:fructosamine-3-kinase
VRVVRVLVERPHGLDLELLRGAAPSARAAEELGRGLAATHAAGAPAFGAPAEGWSGDGFFGPLQQPMPLRAGSWTTWGTFHAEARIVPLRDQLAARGLLSDRLAMSLDRLADHLRAGELDDDRPPARVHGDLWAGNVMWTARGAVLVDPAAHGGHPGADLAMLGLFGLPYLDRVLGAYREAAGWSHGTRHAGLHQVFPVGMHAVLFGAGWLGTLEDLVRPFA